MPAALFNSGDEPYIAWMHQHPKGYVLNARVESGSRSLMLHRSGCQHIAAYTRSDAPDSFTAHKYVKVCSESPSDLSAWAAANRPSDAPTKLCKTCQPEAQPSLPPKLAEEVPDSIAYAEGAVQRVLINAYERDPRAREACLRHYGTSCVVCTFNFGKVYGLVAEGFVHVHHLVPLASVGRNYQVDPIADLRPVCPNCHAVLHLGKKPQTIEELRAVIEKRGEA